MKHYPPALTGAIELKGDETGDDPALVVKSALDDLTKTIDDRLKPIEKKAADLDKLTKRLDTIETRVNRPAVITKTEDGATIERKAFEALCRKGDARLSADEQKALTVATDATAGYLAPTEFASELLKKLVEYSPIRHFARVVTVGASSVKYPRRKTTTAATWVDEIADRTASEPTFEQITITPHELATFTPVSTALLEDNQYNLEAELIADFAEGFGVAEGSAFVKGDGEGKPFGLLAASGIAEVKTGVAGDFPTTTPADVLMGMFHALPAPHAQNGVWVMNRRTLGRIRTWKDSQGRYLCVDPITAGAPVTILGRPIVEAVDMDDVAAGKFPILFGDLSGYRIVDRVSLSVLRDPYTLASKGQVIFHARKRVGADVTHPDRFVKLKVAA